MHFLPKKHCCCPKKHLLPQVFQKLRKSRQILTLKQNNVCLGLKFRPSPIFLAKAICAIAQLLPPCLIPSFLSYQIFEEQPQPRHRSWNWGFSKSCCTPYMLRCAPRLTPLKGIMDEKNCSSTLFCTLTTLHGKYNIFSTTVSKVTLCSKWHLNKGLLEFAAASWAWAGFILGRWLGPGVPPPGWKIRLVFSCCHCCWF